MTEISEERKVKLAEAWLDDKPLDGKNVTAEQLEAAGIGESFLEDIRNQKSSAAQGFPFKFE